MEEYDATDQEWIDCDPTNLDDEQLSLFLDKATSRNFITYMGPEMWRKERKVRVNCKFWPTDKSCLSIEYARI